MTELSGLQIFKYLPAAKKVEHSNCKDCGCPTCMAFAIKLAKKQIEIDKCPFVSDELKKIYLQNSKPPQKIVEINHVKIGGENVLYRHEKTFINKSAIGVVVDMDDSGREAKLNRVSNFEIKRINEILKIDLIVTKNGKLDGAIPFEDIKKLPLIEIVDENFSETSEKLIDIRKKAVLEKDEKCSDPVYVYFKHTDDMNFLCAKASYYICKYANMLIFEDFNEEMIASLMTLRQSIFTDPQKPLQVDPGIYEFNNPDENSLVFMTTNFALTYFAVANELESLSVPSYLIVTPSDGMSVLTAWSAEKFTAKVAADTLKKFDFKNRIKTRSIIIPGLLAHMKDELEEELEGFKIIVGTVNAYDTKDFVSELINNKLK